MVDMRVTVNISKGWETWSKMAKGLEPQMNEVALKSFGLAAMRTKLRSMS